MVFVNNQKFACESCIKGHRSSSCHHTERPLFEIKKKGRPVSQCEKCRELRKTKRMHNKCNCSAGSPCDTSTYSYSDLVAQSADADASTSAKPPSSKSRRFRPIAPALPNGLRDVFAAHATSSSLADPRAKLDTLLNPCHCQSVWQCRCRTADPDGAHDVPSTPATAPEASRAVLASGLVTLAQAAAFCCSQELPQPQTPSTSPGRPSSPPLSASEPQRRKHRREPRSGRTSPTAVPEPKRPKHLTHSHSYSHPHLEHAHVFTLELPPILEPDPQARAPPVFPPIPSLAALTAAPAEDGCCCDAQCACPGCTQHRGPAHASADFRDCGDGCGTCVDPHDAAAGAPPPSFIDAFFARAAALPPPPRRRARLDAADVTVYPATVRAGADAAREAWGLVTLPRLECGCAGGCGCPEGRCTCGGECGGCCDDEAAEGEGENDVEGVQVHADEAQAAAVAAAA